MRELPAEINDALVLFLPHRKRHKLIENYSLRKAEELESLIDELLGDAYQLYSDCLNMEESDRYKVMHEILHRRYPILTLEALKKIEQQVSFVTR